MDGKQNRRPALATFFSTWHSLTALKESKPLVGSSREQKIWLHDKLHTNGSAFCVLHRKCPF
jgi:hypothetical protein